MENFGKHNQQTNISSEKKPVLHENFEQAAGIKIHKGKERYGGGSGYYSAKAKGESPNANQECCNNGSEQSRH